MARQGPEESRSVKMALGNRDGRKTFQETMQMIELPSSGEVKRFMSTASAWLPGSDVALSPALLGPGKPFRGKHLAAYGGHVYCQAALAASRAVEDMERTRSGDRALDLHVSYLL